MKDGSKISGLLIYGGIALLFLFMGGIIEQIYRKESATADKILWQEYHERSLTTARDLSKTFRSIYESLRTIARLPGVRNIDRYGKSFSADSRATVQELYNNLSTSVFISEFYIVPLDLEPDRIDPQTGKLQEPITTFDNFIVGRLGGLSRKDQEKSTVPEIEIHEYRLMKQQLAWFRAHCPTEESIIGLNYPALTGPEVITCNNSHFDPKNPRDADRSGLVYSVPFFDKEGQLKGCISGVILSRDLQPLLPSSAFILHHASHHYLLSSTESPSTSLSWIERDEPDPNLPYSEVLPLNVVDEGGPWFLWSGQSHEILAREAERLAVHSARRQHWLASTLLTLALAGITAQFRRNQRMTRERNATLEQIVEQRTLEFRQSEARAHAIHQASPLGIFVMDALGQCLYTNPAFEEITGRTLQDVIREGWRTLIHPDDRLRILNKWSAAIKQRVPFEVEFQIVHRNGGVLWIHMKAAAMMDHPQAPEYVATIEDITTHKVTKEAMRQREEKFRALFEHSMDAHLLYDDHGIIDCNQAAISMMGVSAKKDLLRLHPLALSPEQQADGRLSVETFPSMEKLAREKKYHQFNWIHRKKDQSEFPVEASLTPITLGGHAVMLLVWHDLTLQRKSEQDSARLASILDSSTDAIVSKDLEGTITQWNLGAERLFGYRADEILKKTVYSMIPQELHETEKMLLQEIRRGKHLENHETVRLSRDGRRVNISLSASPIRDLTGKITGVFTIARDITEQIREEELLRRSEEQLRLVMSATNDGFYDWNLSNSSCHLSAGIARMLGYSHSTPRIAVTSHHEWVHPDDQDPMIEQWELHLSGKLENFEMEYRLKTENGSWKWVLDRGKVVRRDPAGKPLRVLGTLSDISERKEAAAQVELLHQNLITASHQAGMAEVATGVLHNVGHILNSVNVSANLVIQSLQESHVSRLSQVTDLLMEHREDLGSFLTRDSRGIQIPNFLKLLSESLKKEQTSFVQELESLIRNIDHIRQIVSMQQSYAETSGVIMEASIVDLIEDALSMNSAAFMKRGVQIIREYEKLPIVFLDKHKALQILVNLISNAKQALSQDGSSEEKKLVLKLEVIPEQRFQVKVIDNGIGIPQENLVRIFSHGFTTKRHGHGFGLHSSALAAHEMGGSLTVQSDGPGTGATFTLQLPLREARQWNRQTAA